MSIEKRTLKSQLLIYISLLIVALSVLIAGMDQKQFYRIINKEVASSRVDVLKQVGERISSAKNSILYVLNMVSSNETLKTQMLLEKAEGERQQVFTDGLNQLVKQIDGAFQSSDFRYKVQCYCANGLWYGENEPMPGSMEMIKNELWFKELLKNPDETLWISSSVGQMKNAKSKVSAVQAVKGSDDKIRGVIMVSVDEAFFGDTYENILNQDNEIYIIDNSGKIVSSNQKSRLGLRYFNMDNLADLIGEQKYTLVSNQQGREINQRLISAVLDEASTWTVVELIKTDKIFAEAEAVMQKSRLFVMAAILIAGIWILYFANKTVRPLKQLEHDMERVKNGEINVETEIKGWQEIYSIRDNFNEMMVKIQGLMDEIRKREREKHQLELNFLQAQINPHFLYNTLFSIKCLVEMDENENAALMLGNFIDLLRMILKKDGEYITLKKELEFINKYTQLLKYRYEEKFEIYFDIPQNCQDVLVPKLILQPLIENAVFHGIEPKNSNGVIVVNAKMEQGNLSIFVSDDGIGMTKQRQLEILEAEDCAMMGNIGIPNVNSRIQLLYGEEYGLRLESEPDCGTTVVIEMPCFFEGEAGR